MGRSPSPNKTNLSEVAVPALDFPEAMKVVRGGGKVSRLIWNDQGIYVFSGFRLTLHGPYKSESGVSGPNDPPQGALGDHAWLVSRDDLEALDWYAV